jgi:hypothetical protein
MRFFVIDFVTGEIKEVKSIEEGLKLIEGLNIAALYSEEELQDGTIERKYIKIKKEA